jgi:hypothetical protein
MAGEWLAQLPDDLKTNETLTSYATIGDFAKAHLDKVTEFEGKVKESDGKVTDLTKRLENAVFMPGKDAKPEEVNAFYQKIGRPENQDGYKITKPADLPEGIAYDPAIETEFKKFAFEKGLSAAQAESLYGWYYQLVKNGYDNEQANTAKVREETINKLKTDWGQNFEPNKELAIRAFKAFGKDDAAAFLTKKVDGVALGDHPAFLKLFHEIGSKIAPDSALFDKGGGGGDDTPEAQERQRAEKMFPSMNKK